MYDRNQVYGCGQDSSGSGVGPLTVSCEHGNGASRYINGGEFLDYLRDYFFIELLYYMKLLIG
jgi:hypothetical protein